MNDTELAEIQERNLRAARLERIQKVNEGMRDYYGSVFELRKDYRGALRCLRRAQAFLNEIDAYDRLQDLRDISRDIQGVIAADNKELAPHVLADFANLRRRYRGEQ